MIKVFSSVFSEKKIAYLNYMEENIDEINDMLEKFSKYNVTGLLSKHDIAALYYHAKISKTRIIEIGTFYGLSTCLMALANPSIEIVSIDICFDSLVNYYPPIEGMRWICNHDLKENIPQRNIKDIRQQNIDNLGITNVKFIGERSHAYCHNLPDDNDMIFIDGSHDEEAVFLDLLLYAPKIIPGGTILLHDNSPDFPGVNRAIKLYLERYDTGRLDNTIYRLGPEASSMSVLKVKG